MPCSGDSHPPASSKDPTHELELCRALLTQARLRGNTDLIHGLETEVAYWLRVAERHLYYGEIGAPTYIDMEDAVRELDGIAEISSTTQRTVNQMRAALIQLAGWIDIVSERGNNE